MYRVVKERGNNVNVFVENTETKKSLNIGRLSMDILKILEDAGYKFGTAPGETNLKDAWQLPISGERKDQLAKLAMRMSKPIRDQRKKPASEQAATTPDGVPDLFDLIFG